MKNEGVPSGQVILNIDQCGAVFRLIDRSLSVPHSYTGDDKRLLWAVRDAISKECIGK